LHNYIRENQSPHFFSLNDLDAETAKKANLVSEALEDRKGFSAQLDASVYR
jgi:hypothetical protein